MDKALILQKILSLKSLFEQGAIPTLAQHEIHPDLPMDSKERYLYFTLPVSLNFQRSSPAMRQAAYATWHDPETHYLFDPHQVIAAPYEKVQVDLAKHKLSLQKNKHTMIRYTICTSLARDYDGDPRRLLSSKHSCVLQISDYLQSNKKVFPYLNGPKMSHYRLYILTHYTDLKLQNAHRLSIIPDTHIQQSSVALGIVAEWATPMEIIDAWYKLLELEELTPVEMHPVLWNRSRNNFQPMV